MTHDLFTPEFYLSLINRHCGLLCVVDENGFFKFANKALFDITGYHSEDLQEKLVIEYLHNNDLQPVKNVFLQLRKKKTAEYLHFRIKNKDGSWKWMDAVITNYLQDDVVNGYVISARDITSKKDLLIDLEKNQGFYTSFFKRHPHTVFLLSPDGIFEHLNENVCRLMAYKQEEMIGEHFSKFIAPSFSFEAIKAVIKAGEGEPSTLEGKVVSKKGKILTLRFTILPIFLEDRVTSILGVGEDVTAEKKALKELEKLSVIASKAVSSVVITDAAGKIEWVNSEFTKVTGYTMRESVGRKPGDLLQGKETDPKVVHEMRQQIKNKVPFSIEVINYRKNGEQFWISMDITPLFNDNGKVTKYFALQSDITPRKEAEERTRLLAEDLTRRNRELQQFNYIVSHNLRAPVANILGLSSILENNTIDRNTVSKAIDKIKLTAQNLDHVIKDLDHILSLRNYVNGVHDEEVNIDSVCQEVVQSLQPAIESIAATVTFTIPDSICILANRAYIYSIFHNLLSNSLKYHSPERTAEINISYEPEEDTHTFKFKDNGVGMDLSKYGDRLFKLYGKVDKQAEGRGLGLFMVKTQVESLDGIIDVISEPGTGTTFIISFPKNRKPIPVIPATLPSPSV